MSKLIVVIVIVVSLGFFSILPLVRADAYVFESGYALRTCDYWQCYQSSVAGVSASILVNSESISVSGESISQWVSLDGTAYPDGVNGVHIWVQTGWILGSTPSGYYATPVFYAESQALSPQTNYTFRVMGSATFGTSHAFAVWRSATSWNVAIDGSTVYSVPTSQLISNMHPPAALEEHEPTSSTPTNLSGNGHWSNLQFYCNGWTSWGHSDCTDIWPSTTSHIVFVTCYGLSVAEITGTEFVVGTPLVMCTTGGSGCAGCRLSAPIASNSTALVGQGIGPAPVNASGLFWYTYVIIGGIISAVASVALWQIWKYLRSTRDMKTNLEPKALDTER
jgi:hypothetical protein